MLIDPSRKTHEVATLDQAVPVLVWNAVGVKVAQPKDTLRQSKLREQIHLSRRHRMQEGSAPLKLYWLVG